MAIGDIIARLSVELGLNTAEFERGSQRATTTAGRLQASMGKAANAIKGAFTGLIATETLTQLRDMTQAAVDSAGGLGEQAAAAGVSTTALQEYRYAATQVGLSAQEMDNGLAQLTRRLGDAALGAKGPSDALAALGLSIEDVKNKRPEELLPLIADGIARIEDPATRASLAVDLFGKSGQKLATLLEGGSAGIDQMKRAAHELGIVLSEGEIAKADEVADKVAALQFVLEAQQNKKLLENADGLLKYEQGVADLKIAAIDFTNNLQGWADAFDEWTANNTANAVKNGTTIPQQMQAVWDSFTDTPAVIASAGRAVGTALDEMLTSATTWGSEFVAQLRRIGTQMIDGLVAGIKAAPGRVRDALVGTAQGAVDAAKKYLGIKSPSRLFMEIGGFITEGLAIGIDRGKAQPEQALRSMLAGILKKAFPEIEALRQLNEEIATLDRGVKAGLISGAAAEAARGRLGSDFLDSQYGARERDLLTKDPGQAIPAEAMRQQMQKFIDAMNGMGDRSEAITVKVAKNFKDMANETLSALDRMTQAVKGGGFLDILGAVLNLGLQLGDIGVFGKKVQGNINKGIPGYAVGTNSAARGLALVGERGPELVNFRGGESVYTAAQSSRMMNGRGSTHVTFGVDPRTGNIIPFIDGRVQQAAPAIAASGAGMAQSSLARSGKWALG